MKRIIILISMAIAAGLTLTNIYTSIVDVPAWGHELPGSIVTAREYYAVTNPGHFFRIFSPLNQLLGLLALLFFWKNKSMRLWLLTALILYFTGEGMTFKFFYPRNDILFNPTIQDTELLGKVWNEWKDMNWVRTIVIATGFICSSLALHRSYLVVSAKEVVGRRLFAKNQEVAALS